MMKILQECKDEVANKYGYQQWINVSFYEIDERDQITTPPYAKDRLVDEVAELHASQYKELNAELLSALKECMNYVAAESKTRHGHASRLWDKCNSLITKAEQSSKYKISES